MDVATAGRVGVTMEAENRPDVAALAVALISPPPGYPRL